MAVGIVFALRAHLPELAAGADAGSHPRLRDDPRADAPETHGSLAEVLEARGGRVSGLPGRARVAPPRTLTGFSFARRRYRVARRGKSRTRVTPETQRPPRLPAGCRSA